MILEFPRVLDSSMISSYKSCPQKFFLTYLHHWHSKEPSVHLHAGKAFASGIEAARTAFYVDGQNPEDSVALGVRRLLKDYGDFSCPPDSAKSAERMAGAIEYYYASYPLEHDTAVPIRLPGGKRGIEFSFLHPLPINHPDTGEPLLYSGRLDAICGYAGGIFIVDEKTTTSLGPTWSRQWDLRAQFTAYCWGCRESGINVDGCLIRGVSILKTKYDTQHAVTYRPEWQIERWYGQTLDTLAQMVRDWKQFQFNEGLKSDAPAPRFAAITPFKHALSDPCTDFGGCTFRQVCMTQPSTDAYQSQLETYFARRRWNPVTREEEPVS